MYAPFLPRQIHGLWQHTWPLTWFWFIHLDDCTLLMHMLCMSFCAEQSGMTFTKMSPYLKVPPNRSQFQYKALWQKNTFNLQNYRSMNEITQVSEKKSNPCLESARLAKKESRESCKLCQNSDNLVSENWSYNLWGPISASLAVLFQPTGQKWCDWVSITFSITLLVQSNQTVLPQTLKHSWTRVSDQADLS